MTTDAVDVVVVVVAVLVASAAQYTAGFGFSLLGVPLMAVAVRTHDAVIVATWLGLVNSGFQAWQGRAQADRDTVRRLLGGSLLGIPIGLVVFVRVDEGLLKAVLGGLVLVATIVLALRFELAHPGSSPEWVAGIAAGALASSLSTNGPPLVFVLQARRMPIARFRATLAVVFAVSNFVALVGFTLTGELEARPSLWSLAALPAVAIGLSIGTRLRRRVDEESARRLVLGLLGVAGVSAIASAVLA